MAAILATPEIIAHITNEPGTPFKIENRESTAPPPNLQKLTNRELADDSRNAGGFAWAYHQAGYWTDARCAIVVHPDWREPIMFGAEPQPRPGVVQLIKELTAQPEQRLEVCAVEWEPCDDEKKGRKSYRVPPFGEVRALQTITTTLRACRYLVHDQSEIEPGKRESYDIVEKYVQWILKFGRPKKDQEEFWFCQKAGDFGGAVQVVTPSGVIGVVMPRFRKG